MHTDTKNPPSAPTTAVLPSLPAPSVRGPASHRLPVLAAVGTPPHGCRAAFRSGMSHVQRCAFCGSILFPL